MKDDKSLTSPQIPYWLVCLGLVVVGIGATVWGGPWEPIHEVARELGPGIFTAGLLGSLIGLFFRPEFTSSPGLHQSQSLRRAAASTTLLPSDRAAQVAAIISGEFPAFTSGDMNTPFARLGIDSISMLTVRTRVEALAGGDLDPDLWEDTVTPSDLVRALGDRRTVGAAGCSRSSAISTGAYWPRRLDSRRAL